jgi:hypothetical protein
MIAVCFVLLLLLLLFLRAAVVAVVLGSVLVARLFDDWVRRTRRFCETTTTRERGKQIKAKQKSEQSKKRSTKKKTARTTTEQRYKNPQCWSTLTVVNAVP